MVELHKIDGSDVCDGYVIGGKKYAAKINHYYGYGEFEEAYLRTKCRGGSFHFRSIPDEPFVNATDVLYIVELPHIQNREKISISDKHVYFF